jgi:U4/U6 small nuclear ribonucleoprotein SNU13
LAPLLTHFQTMTRIRRRQALLLVIAADVTPITAVHPLVLAAEANSVPFVFVSSKAALGRACGVSLPVSAACLVQSETRDLFGPLEDALAEIDRILI